MEECSTGDLVFVSMVIQVSLLGVVFDSGATTLAAPSSLLAMAGVNGEHWLYMQSTVDDPSYYRQATKCEKGRSNSYRGRASFALCRLIGAQNTTYRTPWKNGHTFYK